jgi:hypothetical protein
VTAGRRPQRLLNRGRRPRKVCFALNGSNDDDGGGREGGIEATATGRSLQQGNFIGISYIGKHSIPKQNLAVT